MSLLTPAELQALGIGLGMSDDDLQAIIDREEAEIVRRFGANYDDAPIDETVRGGGVSLYLRRQIEEIDGITEAFVLGDTPDTLTSADYYAWSGEGRVERLPEGTRWGKVATVSYTPFDDTELRKLVLAELVRIGSEQTTPASSTVSGLTFSIGSSSGTDNTGDGWKAQRNAQYARLGFLGR